MADETQTLDQTGSSAPSGYQDLGLQAFEQALNEYRQASQAVGHDPSAANKLAQQQAQLKLVRVAIQSKILDETTEFGKIFAKFSPDARKLLLDKQQELLGEAGSATLKLVADKIAEQRNSIKNQIDTLFSMEAGGMRSSISFAGIGRAVCSFLRALGVQGMDEYIERFDREIQLATDKPRDVKWQKLNEPAQTVMPVAGQANQGMREGTDQNLAPVIEYAAEALDKSDKLLRQTSAVGTAGTQPQPGTPHASTGSTADSTVVVGTARAIEIARETATNMGIRNVDEISAAVTRAAGADGELNNMSRRDLMALQADLITSTTPAQAEKIIQDINERSATPPPTVGASSRAPALNLDS